MWFECSVFPFEHWFCYHGNVHTVQSVCMVFSVSFPLDHLSFYHEKNTTKQTNTTICHFNIRWENLRLSCIQTGCIRSYIHFMRFMHLRHLKCIFGHNLKMASDLRNATILSTQNKHLLNMLACLQTTCTKSLTAYGWCLQIQI